MIIIIMYLPSKTIFHVFKDTIDISGAYSSVPGHRQSANALVGNQCQDHLLLGKKRSCTTTPPLLSTPRDRREKSLWASGVIFSPALVL